MIRRFSAALASFRLRVGVWLLCSPWLGVVRAPRGRLARARLVLSHRRSDGSSSLLLLCGSVAVVSSGRMPRWLCRFAFWLARD
jgi:hypothetical protein